MTSTPIEWPRVRDAIGFVAQDGTALPATICDVITRGDYPIVVVGLLDANGGISDTVRAKFDPDADRAGTWHMPWEGE